MKLNENFFLRQVADAWIVIPIGQDMLDFNGLIRLNETGALLWKALEQGGDLAAMADALCAEYEVDRATAEADAAEFLDKLKSAGCLED